jgi:hypothetical protein
MVGSSEVNSRFYLEPKGLPPPDIYNFFKLLIFSKDVCLNFLFISGVKMVVNFMYCSRIFLNTSLQFFLKYFYIIKILLS